MFIINIPSLIIQEYYKFYNLSGLYEFSLKKAKLENKSYDQIIEYLRSTKIKNIHDSVNITALFDYNTGLPISKSKKITQYNQFIIIRHPMRKIILEYDYDEEEDGGPPYRDEDKILFDDREFVTEYLAQHDPDLYEFTFYLNISRRLMKSKQIAKVILRSNIWHMCTENADKSAKKIFSRLNPKLINNKNFILKCPSWNAYDTYEYLPYKIQLDADIIDYVFTSYTSHSDLQDISYHHIYDLFMVTFHPDAVNSYLLRKYIVNDEYLVDLSKYIPHEKLDNNILDRINRFKLSNTNP